AAEDVRPMGRAVHPRLHDLGGAAEPLAAPGDVLTDDPAARARQVVDRADAAHEVAVGEEVAGGHAVGVAPGSEAGLPVHVEWSQAVPAALGVQQADRADVDLLDRRAV